MYSVEVDFESLAIHFKFECPYRFVVGDGLIGLARDDPVGKRPNSICTGLKNTTTQTQSEMLKQGRRSTPPPKQKKNAFLTMVVVIPY